MHSSPGCAGGPNHPPVVTTAKECCEVRLSLLRAAWPGRQADSCARHSAISQQSHPLTTEQPALQACFNKPGCNAWTFCWQLQGCGSGCHNSSELSWSGCRSAGQCSIWLPQRGTAWVDCSLNVLPYNPASCHAAKAPGERDPALELGPFARQGRGLLPLAEALLCVHSTSRSIWEEQTLAGHPNLRLL